MFPSPVFPTVLVVDDNPDIRDLLSFILEPGYHVVTAGSGEEALAILSAAALAGKSVALLLTDVVMGGMTGLELGREVKRINSTLPVLYMTGFPFGADPSYDFAGTNFLLKPFRAAELLTAVRTLIAAGTGPEWEHIKTEHLETPDNSASAS